MTAQDMRMSTRRLRAVIDAAGRGLDEWDMDGEGDPQKIEAASEGYKCLLRELRRREEGATE
jgi:hypothetical protein